VSRRSFVGSCYARPSGTLTHPRPGSQYSSAIAWIHAAFLESNANGCIFPHRLRGVSGGRFFQQVRNLQTLRDPNLMASHARHWFRRRGLRNHFSAPTITRYCSRFPQLWLLRDHPDLSPGIGVGSFWERKPASVRIVFIAAPPHPDPHVAWCCSNALAKVGAFPFPQRSMHGRQQTCRRQRPQKRGSQALTAEDCYGRRKTLDQAQPLVRSVHGSKERPGGQSIQRRPKRAMTTLLRGVRGAGRKSGASRCVVKYSRLRRSTNNIRWQPLRPLTA
jgi:hypothetical protein